LLVLIRNENTSLSKGVKASANSANSGMFSDEWSARQPLTTDRVTQSRSGDSFLDVPPPS
jgi:hypothetical protein